MHKCDNKFLLGGLWNAWYEQTTFLQSSWYKTNLQFTWRRLMYGGDFVDLGLDVCQSELMLQAVRRCCITSVWITQIAVHTRPLRFHYNSNKSSCLGTFCRAELVFTEKQCRGAAGWCLPSRDRGRFTQLWLLLKKILQMLCCCRAKTRRSCCLLFLNPASECNTL